MTPEFILKAIGKYGFPTVAAVALAWFVYHLNEQAARDRDTYTQFLWSQINDVQVDLHTLKVTCERKP